MRWLGLGVRGVGRAAAKGIALLVVGFGLESGLGSAAVGQENPLGDVHTAAPAPAPPKDARPAVTGGDVAGKATTAAGSAIRVDVNLVLVPMTVTDPLNRLVTGLERENFAVYDNNVPQTIKSFATEDAPLSIGIVFDLSGSMQSKFIRARKALAEFLRTSNPLDEFFVVGFNDRPAILVDYTSDVEDVEARMVMLKPENRTALVDAIYLSVNKLKNAKFQRKALLVISDGGDNRSRYTSGELTRAVRESEVQIYSIGIFDAYAPTEEEINGPVLLKELSEATGGRMFKVLDMQDLTDIAERISEELRNEYVIGYTPTDRGRNGQWRKLRVRLMEPPGLPPLTVHNREGYYAPTQ
ncbi:MAG TPA: VWA domain-containing protein [Acidobacteriaceae bacterium]|jgi:Ca-activated chloride channel family protein|nr:VWA domain-containing protein [Acidobacteriaceae bacterium]